MQDDDPAEPTTGWSYCGQKTQFRQLPIGAVFATDRETESRISRFRGQPGAHRYVKVGTESIGWPTDSRATIPWELS